MAGSSARMSPEFALEAAIESVPALSGKVSALQPPQTATAPFAFYIPTADEEDETLEGGSGLQSFAGTLHIVAGGFRQLLLLCALVKRAITDMKGRVYSTPQPDTAAGPKGRVLIERAEIEQSSPDLLETEVGLYRRTYTIRLDYQTEEFYDEEVVSG